MTTYPTREETIVRAERAPRFLALNPPPELAMTEPSARLERGWFATVAAVCDALADEHNLQQMTRGDLVRLIRLGDLAVKEMEERKKDCV